MNSDLSNSSVSRAFIHTSGPDHVHPHCGCRRAYHEDLEEICYYLRDISLVDINSQHFGVGHLQTGLDIRHSGLSGGCSHGDELGPGEDGTELSQPGEVLAECHLLRPISLAPEM